MRVAISSMVIARIVAESRASPDHEICGLLLGRGDVVVEARRCRNVADDPARRFEIDPAALIAAHRATRGGAAAVLGHYHSHPTGIAEPSLRDAADAAPDGALWLIVAGEAVSGWCAVRDGAVHGRFDPVTLADVAPCVGDSGASEGATDTKDQE